MVVNWWIKVTRIFSVSRDDTRGLAVIVTRRPLDFVDDVVQEAGGLRIKPKNIFLFGTVWRTPGWCCRCYVGSRTHCPRCFDDGWWVLDIR